MITPFAILSDLSESNSYLSPARRLAQVRQERKDMKTNLQLRSSNNLPLAILGDLCERNSCILPAKQIKSSLGDPWRSLREKKAPLNDLCERKGTP
jgi:hypothetical protein